MFPMLSYMSVLTLPYVFLCVGIESMCSLGGQPVGVTNSTSVAPPNDGMLPPDLSCEADNIQEAVNTANNVNTINTTTREGQEVPDIDNGKQIFPSVCVD
jgi:hypothetical protein